MMIIRMTAASLPGTSGRPLDIAALISWLLTASIGAYMLRTWIARGGGRGHRRAGRLGLLREQRLAAAGLARGRPGRHRHRAGHLHGDAVDPLPGADARRPGGRP